MNELKIGLISSILLHGAFIYVIATGLPLTSRDLPTPDRPVPVEIVEIDDVTRVKEPEPEPEKEPVPATRQEVRPQPPQDAVPNPDLKPKPKPDPVEVDRKKLVANVTPQEKPRPPSNFDAGQIAALIDKSIKDKPAENTREKDLEEAVDQSLALGLQAKRNTATIKDFVKSRMRECWRHPGGALNAGELIVIIRFRLNIDGFLVGTPKIQNQSQILGSNNPFYQTAAENALRAVRLCEPYELPKELYDDWKELELNFDPSEMVG